MQSEAMIIYILYHTSYTTHTYLVYAIVSNDNMHIVSIHIAHAFTFDDD